MWDGRGRAMFQGSRAQLSLAFGCPVLQRAWLATWQSMGPGCLLQVGAPGHEVEPAGRANVGA